MCQPLATTINHYQHWLTLTNPNHVHIVLTGRCLPGEEGPNHEKFGKEKPTWHLHGLPVMLPREGGTVFLAGSSVKNTTVKLIWWSLTQIKIKCLVSDRLGRCNFVSAIFCNNFSTETKWSPGFPLQDRVGSGLKGCWITCQAEPTNQPKETTSPYYAGPLPWWLIIGHYHLPLSAMIIMANCAVLNEHPIANYSIWNGSVLFEDLSTGFKLLIRKRLQLNHLNHNSFTVEPNLSETQATRTVTAPAVPTICSSTVIQSHRYWAISHPKLQSVAIKDRPLPKGHSNSICGIPKYPIQTCLYILGWGYYFVVSINHDCFTVTQHHCHPSALVVNYHYSPYPLNCMKHHNVIILNHIPHDCWLLSVLILQPSRSRGGNIPRHYPSRLIKRHDWLLLLRLSTINTILFPIIVAQFWGFITMVLPMAMLLNVCPLPNPPDFATGQSYR